MAPKKIAAGNWKMNGVKTSLSELDQLAAGEGCDVLICPPFTLIALAAGRAGAVQIGGQDCHANASGAHTGDISAPMLKDAGASFVITGHSERRADHGESDAIIAAKTLAAHHAGLIAIVCIGETEAQRDAGDTLGVIASQLDGSVPDGSTAQNTVIAYEPVWAIGTGLTATDEQANETIGVIRKAIAEVYGDDVAQKVRIQYGGSMKGSNVKGLMAQPEIDGGLIGGASLKAEDFAQVVNF